MENAKGTLLNILVIFTVFSTYGFRMGKDTQMINMKETGWGQLER